MRRGWQPPRLDDNTKLLGDDDSNNTLEWKCSTPVMELQLPSLILADLYVGSMADAADALWRGNPLGIKAVVNCAEDDWLHQVKKGRVGSEAAVFCGELRDAFTKLQNAPEGAAHCGKVMGVEYLGFSAKDGVHHEASAEKRPPVDKEPKVGDHFPAAMAFVRRHLVCGQKVLVHCLKGENRSAAVCAAFLITERGMGCEEAIALMRDKRGSNALSNETFVDELRLLTPFHNNDSLPCPPEAMPAPSPTGAEALEFPTMVAMASPQGAVAEPVPEASPQASPHGETMSSMVALASPQASPQPQASVPSTPQPSSQASPGVGSLLPCAETATPQSASEWPATPVKPSTSDGSSPTPKSAACVIL